MSIASDIIRGHTDAIILAHLLSGDTYGYEINKSIQNITGNQYDSRRLPCTPRSAGLRPQG